MPSTDQSSGQINSARTEESSTTHTSGENKVEHSKNAIRKQVWTNFEKKGLVTFPRPVRGRIPNFHGAPEAAAKLAELNVFKKANYVKVNADKPQENVRILTLENKKNLLVPSPRISEAVFMHVVPEGTGKEDLKKAASRRGMLRWGKLIYINTDIKIDLVVMGSVAVSRQGHRIGKGEGFGDIEFAVLMDIGAITSDTVVVTTVHESQVFDTLPQSLFKEYDVPVDIIITPTEVIEITNKLPKPKGVFWNMLSQRKLNLMNVLKALREKYKAAGKECELKAEDAGSETERITRRFFPVRRFIRYSKKRSPIKSDGTKLIEDRKTEVEEKVKEKKKPSRRFNRRFLRTIATSDANNQVNMRKEKGGHLRRRRFPPSAPIEFSLRIGNITSNVRVRDLKNALAERNVKPTEITWRGHKGFAFIHFAKPKQEPTTPIFVDNIVASLQDMKIGDGKEGVTLLVEPAKPITKAAVTPEIPTV
ncbi:UNVERIFIED_CONTAM: hypothetical protein PYX00_004249 [Menopon gallinae]|uniref:Methenyltetrahydrofolate synthase domain-containing protein n=2 Tax=Menopon gallinae TaxID=328185 RepID=A0AAW2I4G6_9NEOP